MGSTTDDYARLTGGNSIKDTLISSGVPSKHKPGNEPEAEAADVDTFGHSKASLANIQVEQLHALADRVVKDAEVMAAMIRQQAEAAARTIELANRKAQNVVYAAQKDAETAAEAARRATRALQEAKQRAVAVEAEATVEVAQAKLKVKGEVEKHLSGVIEKIRESLGESLGPQVENAEIEDPDRPVASNLAPAVSQSLLVVPTEERISRTVSELHSELRDAIGMVDVSASGAASDGSVAPEPEIPASGPVCLSSEEADLWEGQVEIEIAPPVTIARLLAVTRFLENQLNLKLLQTAGSWTLGSVVTVILDKPLPLVGLLRDTPHLDSVKVGNGPCGTRRILVTLGGGRGA